MRIDKFLKISRIIKRRTIAQEAASSGKVMVNGKAVKPSFAVKVGDEVAIQFSSALLKFKILSIKETVKKQEAESLYEIIS